MEDVWLDPEGNLLMWDNWDVGEPNNWDNKEDCVSVLTKKTFYNRKRFFLDLECFARSSCTTCMMQERRSFKLSGLCQESQVDSYYV